MTHTESSAQPSTMDTAAFLKHIESAFRRIFSDDLKPDNNDNELLRTLSGQLGVSIVNSRLEQERRLLAVLFRYNSAFFFFRQIGRAHV